MPATILSIESSISFEEIAVLPRRPASMNMLFRMQYDEAAVLDVI